jgi:ornithine cyclodeaminase/alanine dehydrogenase-like protein (mu-crystallin family)
MTDTNSLLQQVLRVHDEPYRYYNDWEVHDLLTRKPIEYLDHLMELLDSLARAESAIDLPHKLVFEDAGAMSDFRVMPCVLRHPKRVRKTVKLVGTNTRQRQVPDQIVVGKAFALDAGENFINAGFAGCLLSSARTGACAATAARLLARSAKRVAIIGSGRVGYYAAFYIAALGNTAEFIFHDRLENRAQDAARALQRAYPAINTTTAMEKATDADVVVLATDSIKPVYGEGRPTAGLIISLGADTHWQHELSPLLLDNAEVCVDTIDSFSYGDLRLWREEGRISREQVTDLIGLLRKRSEPAVQTVFISTGSALFDNLTIDYLLEQNSSAL